MSDRHPVLPGAEAWESKGHGPRAAVGLLVVHGFTGNPSSVRAVAEALATRGFAVEVPRLPGHGTSVRDMMRTTYPDWRAEVERALSSLQRRCSQVVLVGLSMGGTLVLDVASRGARVAGVVSINAQLLDREDFGARLAPYVEKLIPLVPAALAGLAKNDAAKPGVDEKAYAFVPPRAGNSLVNALPAIRGRLGDLRIPALIAYSTQDHSVPPENSKAIARMLGGDDVTLLPLERSYHLATLDYDAGLLIEKISEFAERVALPRARNDPEQQLEKPS